MPPPQHVSNGLARRVDESMLAWNIGTTGHSKNISSAAHSQRRHNSLTNERRRHTSSAQCVNTPSHSRLSIGQLAPKCIIGLLLGSVDSG